MLFVVKCHSIIDVITNSSSELFIPSSDGDTISIKELVLSVMLSFGYTEDQYGDFFEEPYLYTRASFIDDSKNKWAMGTREKRI